MRYSSYLLLSLGLLLSGCATSRPPPPSYIGPRAAIRPPPEVRGNPNCVRYTLDISRRPILCSVIKRTPIVLDGNNTRYVTYQAIEDTLDDAGHVIVPARSIFYGLEDATTGASVAICRFVEYGQSDVTLAQGVTPAHAQEGDKVSLYLSYLAVPVTGK
jgi:hypothetical protein